MISKDPKAEHIKDTEINLEKLESEVFEKFKLTDLIEKSNTIPFYSKILHYFNCVVETVNSFENIDQNKKDIIYHWAGVMFNAWHGLGLELTTFEYAKEGMKLLNQHLALRSTILNYELSWIDVIAIWSIRQNTVVILASNLPFTLIYHGQDKSSLIELLFISRKYLMES